MVIITDKRTKEGREFRSWMKFVCLCDGYEPTDHEYSDSVRLMPVRFNWRSRIKKGFNSLKELKSEIKEAYNEIKNRERLLRLFSLWMSRTSESEAIGSSSYGRPDGVNDMYESTRLSNSSRRTRAARRCWCSASIRSRMVGTA